MKLPIAFVSPRSLAAALVALALVASGSAETLRIRADAWMPYNGTPGDAQPGYVIEIAKKIFEPAGIEIDYGNMPWGDALKAAAADEIDGVIGANRTEAAGLVVPQESIGEPRVGLYVRKGTPWRYSSVASLAQVRLGVVLDYKYWEVFDRYVATHDAPQVVKFSGDRPLRDAIERLAAGELDVIAESAPVFSWTLRESGRAAGEFVPAYIHEGESIYLAFAPRGENGARYAKLFDEGLRRLRQSGELTAILARYGLRDWLN